MNEFPFVLDRNGREIKLGDRVKIIAEECNKFMHYWYGENWIPEMHFDKDEFGTVEIQDEFAQIVNEYGDMLIDLSLSEGGTELSLEIVDSDTETISNNCYIKSTSCSSVSTKETPTVFSFNETLIAWFGEESGRNLAEAFAHCEPKKKCVYVLHMDNDTIKIGVAKNFDRRKNTVSTSSGLKIINWYHTNYFMSRDAYAIESACHKFFKNQRIKGEFFRISYEAACSELQKQVTNHFLSNP